MKIRLARTAGFCWGVKSALQTALKLAPGTSRQKQKVYTYGPIIHNQDVVEMLKDKNIKPRLRLPVTRTSSVLILRAHGLAPQVQKQLGDKGYQLVDATCPYVKRIQKKVQEFSRRGYEIIICGDKKHAEVAGLMGYARRKPGLVSSIREARSLKLDARAKYCILAQSTFNKSEYQKIAKIIEVKLSNGKAFGKVKNLVVLDTICRSSAQRQAEVLRMAQEVDAIIVIGARHSANTSRLAQIARRTGRPTFHIQSEKELNARRLTKYRRVGVTSGTSTPDWIIARVVNFLKQIQYLKV